MSLGDFVKHFSSTVLLNDKVAYTTYYIVDNKYKHMQKTLHYPLDDLGDILCHFIFYFHDILAVLNKYSSYLPKDIFYFILFYFEIVVSVL